MPPEPEGATEFIAPSLAMTPVFDDFDKASFELRIHTANAELSGGFVAERKTRPAEARPGPERTRATG